MSRKDFMAGYMAASRDMRKVAQEALPWLGSYCSRNWDFDEANGGTENWTSRLNGAIQISRSPSGDGWWYWTTLLDYDTGREVEWYSGDDPNEAFAAIPYTLK